jgi:hypothetical protein
MGSTHCHVYPEYQGSFDREKTGVNEDQRVVGIAPFYTVGSEKTVYPVAQTVSLPCRACLPAEEGTLKEP